MKRCYLWLMIVVVVGVCGFCQAYPEPSVIGGANDWTLEVMFAQPRQISVKVSAGRSGAVEKRFWYIILTLTNTAGFDVPFYPACDLVTDTFHVVGAGVKANQAVFKEIRRRHFGKYPFLESSEQVADKILQGADNTKDIVIIWPDFDAKAKNVTLFIGGLSNETVAIDHPVKIDKNGKPVKVYLRKTLALEYGIGGDETLRANARLAYKDKRWVMR